MARTEAQKKIAAKRARRPIYGTWMHAAVLETGESRLGFFASHPVDRRLLKERGFRKDVECRAEFKMPRNGPFHRLLHAVGNVLVDNVEGFESHGSHDAVKRIQVEADVCCEVIEMDATPVVTALLDASEALLGAGARKVLAAVLPEIKTIPVKIARSMAYDEMDDDEFALLFKGVTNHIDVHYGPSLTADVKAEYLLMVEGNQQ